LDSSKNFEGVFGFHESHVYVLLYEVNLPGFDGEAGLGFVLRLRTELTGARVHGDDEIVIATVDANPFAVHGELGLNLVSQHGGANDNENSLIGDDLGLGMGLLIGIRFELFGGRAAG